MSLAVVKSAPVAPVLALQDVHVRFGGVRALSEVSLEIPPGPGVSAIIGPNGAGKTTLFNVLTGIIRPSQGAIRIADRDVTGLRPDEIFRTGVSRTFQGVRLFAHLSVLENVALAARSALPRGARAWFSGAGEAEDRAKACLEATGVEPRLWSLWPDRLTLLEQRLVEMARAMTAKPLVMLLDEPAAGLNTVEKQRLCALFETLAQTSGCRVVVVEHDMKLVMSVAKRIWVMNFGRLLAQGTPSEIRTNEAVIEAYLGAQAQHD